MPQHKKFFSFPNFHCYIFCKSHDPLHILLNCYNRSPMDQQPSFSALTLFRSRIQHLSKQSIITMRQELFQVLNGDAFYPISSWPNEYQLLFWKKPIGDVDTFKLFFIFRWKWLFPANNYRMDPYLAILEQFF